MPLSKNQNAKKAKHSKSESNNRLTAIYILSILKEYSTRENPMSISAIQKKLEEDYCQDSNMTVPDIKTIRTQLQNMIYSLRNYTPATSYIQRYRFGFDIILCGKTKKDGKLVYDEITENTECLNNFSTDIQPTEYEIAEEKGLLINAQYYYYKNIFDDKEMNLMMQSLESYNYLSSEDISELVLKLNCLNPQAVQSKHYDQPDAPRLRNEDSNLLTNMQDLHDIIMVKGFAKILLGYYNADHQLATYTPKKEYLVRPLRIIFNNGYYYLLASQFSESKQKHFTNHFRVDRLILIDACKKDSVPNAEKYPSPDAFQADAASYRLHHPVMYGDDLIRVTMLVENSEYMLNVLMDFFGTAAMIKPYDASAANGASQSSFLEVKLDQVAQGGVRLFATEYCSKVRILTPTKLADAVRKDLAAAMELYDDQDEG